MREIWIPEFLIILFLCLPLLKLFFKKLQALDGLFWLPLIALLIAMALIPAYGFRPETLPLLIYAAIMTCGTFFRFAGRENRRGSMDSPHPATVIALLVLLAAAGGIAFFFTPQRETVLSSGNTGGNVIAAGEYSVRVYTDENDRRPSQRPLVILLPSSFGSLSVVDQVSTELRDRGFTALAWSGQSTSVGGIRRLRAFSSGHDSAKANAYGVLMEEEWKENLNFILSWIRQNPRINESNLLFDIASSEAVFIAGYDAAGSSLVLHGNSLPTGRVRLRGFIAIESRLWSLYRTEAPAGPEPPSEIQGFRGWFSSVGYGIRHWFWERKPRQITGFHQPPNSSIPSLFLVSDRAHESKYRDGQYSAVFRYHETARSSVTLAWVEGAGPLDYSDFPVQYPIITALFPGRSNAAAWNNLEAPAGTALIITNFAAEVLEAESGSYFLRKEALPAGVSIQRR